MATWRRQVQDQYKIHLISEEDMGALLTSDNVLWTTRCSATKPSEAGKPIEMYDSYITRYFYRFVQEHRLPYAIVSDRYGLHFDDETLPYYDIHPRTLCRDQKERLGKEIRTKAKARGFEKIVFYNNSPLMSKPYFEMLSNSDLWILFTTKLILA